jgi:hypothetical protein
MACSGVNLTFIMEINVFTYWKFILLLNFEQFEKQVSSSWSTFIQNQDDARSNTHKFEKHLNVTCVGFLDRGLQL